MYRLCLDVSSGFYGLHRVGRHEELVMSIEHLSKRQDFLLFEEQMQKAGSPSGEVHWSFARGQDCHHRAVQQDRVYRQS